MRFLDKNTDGDESDAGDNTLYFATDANHNVTAVVTAAGTVPERYAYEPYGKARFFGASWVDLSGSGVDNYLLFAGYKADAESGLYYARNRFYHSTMGVWVTRDPIGYADGMNLVQYIGSMPVTATDPSGLLKVCDLLAECARKCTLKEETAKEKRESGWAGRVQKAMVEARQKCEDELAPEAIAWAVNAALRKLGMAGIARPNTVDKAEAYPGLARRFKADRRSQREWTLSAAAAWEIPIDADWALKLYQTPSGEHEITVGKPTKSFGHFKDTVLWSPGETPINSDNAESFMGQTFYDKNKPPQWPAGCEAEKKAFEAAIK